MNALRGARPPFGRSRLQFDFPGIGDYRTLFAGGVCRPFLSSLVLTPFISFSSLMAFHAFFCITRQLAQYLLR